MVSRVRLVRCPRGLGVKDSGLLSNKGVDGYDVMGLFVFCLLLFCPSNI